MGGDTNKGKVQAWVENGQLDIGQFEDWEEPLLWMFKKSGENIWSQETEVSVIIDLGYKLWNVNW